MKRSKVPLSAHGIHLFPLLLLKKSPMNTTKLFATAVLALCFTTSPHAQTKPDTEHAAHHPAATSATTAPDTDGEVRKVDKEQGKITLKHGPIAKLDMPGMTMVFKVADIQLLEGLKQGDKVRFTAEQVNGALTVTAIDPAK